MFYKFAKLYAIMIFMWFFQTLATQNFHCLLCAVDCSIRMFEYKQCKFNWCEDFQAYCNSLPTYYAGIIYA